MNLVGGLTVAALMALGGSVQARQIAAVAAAAEKGDRTAVRALLKDGADVNAAQGDGTTALHWAAMKGDAELVQMLLVAGANVKATTRLGAFTPLYLAARGGHAEAVAALLAAGADATSTSANGATPLMLAAASGNTRAVTMLVEAGADVNAKDTAKQETALMYAAAFDRPDVIRQLLRSGADAGATSKVVDLYQLTAPEEENMARQAAAGQGRPAPAGPARQDIPGGTRSYRYTELIGTQGGFSALHFAARQGYVGVARALLDGGADINLANPGDRMTPLLVAIINGQFDLAKELVERGADVRARAFNGMNALYAVVNIQWHPKSLYPSPKAYQQQRTTYLELMQALLDEGADPNARMQRKVWYTGFNNDYSGVDETGATPFWRAAYANDVEAMRLLMAHGADPNLPTSKPAGRPFTGDGVRQIQDLSGLPPVPVGGPGVYPIHAASGVGYGEGFAANSHRYAPTGFLLAIKFLVEEAGADVNQVDHEGNTALHLAASRGDNESILYLVSKGADVMRVNREGNTTADMANGPVQRVQPFPETLALLEKLGSKNNHRCVTCN
jgi:ankyrin repeat protein